MKLLSSGDVCELLGVNSYIFSDWCNKGVITPIEGGTKQGDHRRFSIQQTIALAIGLLLRKTVRGCSFEFISWLIKELEGFSDLELRECLVEDHYPFLIEVPAYRIYLRLMKNAKLIENRSKRIAPGRKRGLLKD